MTVPSQMSLRQIPEELHLKVRIAYAASWEALIETHTRQALEFVCEFAQRLPVLEGLDLFFRVIAVPEAMQEVVACRTLTALDLDSLPPLTRPPRLTGLQRFRPDLALENLRFRRRYDERTLELARMVGARVAEAIISTHVENAVEFTRLLKGMMPVRVATDRYLIEFNLPDSIATMVRQRVRARVAGDELVSQYNDQPPRLPEPTPSSPSSPASPASPAASEAPAAPSARGGEPSPTPRSAAPPPMPEPPRLKILP